MFTGQQNQAQSTAPEYNKAWGEDSHTTETYSCPVVIRPQSCTCDSIVFIFFFFSILMFLPSPLQARQLVLHLSRPLILITTPGLTSTDSRWRTSTRAHSRHKPRAFRWEWAASVQVSQLVHSTDVFSYCQQIPRKDVNHDEIESQRTKSKSQYSIVWKDYCMGGIWSQLKKSNSPSKTIQITL